MNLFKLILVVLVILSVIIVSILGTIVGYFIRMIRYLKFPTRYIIGKLYSLGNTKEQVKSVLKNKLKLTYVFFYILICNLFRLVFSPIEGVWVGVMHVKNNMLGQ